MRLCSLGSRCYGLVLSTNFISVIEPQCQGPPEPHILGAKLSRYLGCWGLRHYRVSPRTWQSLLSMIQTDFSNCDRVLGANEVIDKQPRDLPSRSLKAGTVTEVAVAAADPSPRIATKNPPPVNTTQQLSDPGPVLRASLLPSPSPLSIDVLLTDVMPPRKRKHHASLNLNTFQIDKRRSCCPKSTHRRASVRVKFGDRGRCEQHLSLSLQCLY